MGERRGAYRILVRIPQGKRPLGRTRCRWEGNINWIFRKWDVGALTASSWLKIGKVCGHL